MRKERLIQVLKIISVFVLTLILTGGGFLILLASLPIVHANIVAFVLTILVTLAIGYALYQKNKKMNKTHAITTGFVLSLILILANGFVIPKANFSKRPSMKTWELSTGSKLAYWEFKPQDGRTMSETPLIFIHGGPGGTLRKYEELFLQDLANRGHHVYAYEQYGAGSSYEPGIDMKKLTIGRHVQDLNEIQTNVLKKGKITLMGQSNGGTISTRYISEYPEKVDKFIATEPGLFDADLSDNKSSEDPGKENATELYSEKYGESSGPLSLSNFINLGNIFAAYKLGKPIENPTKLLLDTGTDPKETLSQSFCKSDYDKIPEYKTSDQRGTYLWVNMLSNVYFLKDFFAEKKNLTESIKSFKGQVMVALGECSYVDRGLSREYFEKYTNTTNKYYKNIGHVIWGKNDHTSKQFSQDVDDFLREKPIKSDFSDYESLRKLDLQ